MDEAKALLDSLMGHSRDKATKEKRNDEFMDSDVCKFHLVCWCPQDWFYNTRRDLKACTKKHSDHLKQQFEQHPEHKKYRLRYEKEFLRHLEMLCADADNWVAREKRKSRPAGKEVVIPANLKSEFNQLEEEYKRLLEEADKAASEALMQQADDKKTQLDLMKEQHTVDFAGEEVCEICGVRYPFPPEKGPGPVGLSKEQIAQFEHARGKIHQGYEKIREKAKELKEKLRQEENVSEPDKEPVRNPGRDTGDRSRSHGRRANRNKKDDKKEGEQDGDEKVENRMNDRRDDRRDDRRSDRGRDDRRDDRRGRHDSPRRDDRRGEDRIRRRRDDSRDRGRRRL